MKRLLIRPGAIGDFIVSLPAMECLRTSETEVWTSSANVPLARFANRAASITSMGLDLLGIEGLEPPPLLLSRLRTFDSIVSWYGTNRPDFRAAVERLGLPFRFLCALPGQGYEGHAVDFYLEQAACPPESTHSRLPHIDCPGAPEDFVVIHPFSGSRRKNWPIDRFRAVAGALGNVRWCAGPEEVLEDAVRFDDLYQLACWLKCARLYIGNDSGISHLAAAVGTPVIAIFGPTNPKIWAPRGPRVTVLEWPDVETVLRYCADPVGGPSPNRRSG